MSHLPADITKQFFVHFSKHFLMHQPLQQCWSSDHTKYHPYLEARARQPNPLSTPWEPHLMHLSMSSRRGGRRDIGRDFDIFQKIAVKFPTPGQKCEVNDLWSRARTKIQISLPPGQQDNSNPLPPGQGDRSKSRPMPRLPPSPPQAGLTLIGV